MANTISNYIREVWAPEAQDLAMKTAVAGGIVEKVVLPDGDTFHKPLVNDVTVGTYTRNATTSGGGAVTAADVTTSDESLSVNTAKYSSFFIDALDNTQMFYKSLTVKRLRRSAYALARNWDATVLAEYSNAASTVDDGDLDGTASNPITLTTSNALNALEQFKYKYFNQNGNADDLFLVIDHKNYFTVMEKLLATSGYTVQDKTLVNGYMGNILGVDIMVSDNLTTDHWLGGSKGAITMVFQKENIVEEKKNPQNDDGSIRLGSQYIVWNLFGLKTFTDGARELVDIHVSF